MSNVLRTRTLGETRGFMKALVDGQSDCSLGFAMLGPEAGEVMAAVLPYTLLRGAVLTRPTMAEGLGGLFAAIPAPR